MSLKKNGFSVLAVGDGRAAINLFRECAQRIDATLLDLTLPGVSGVDVFHELRRIRPDAKIILTSAYDLERIKAPFTSAEQIPSGFIRKPYRIDELVAALRGAVRNVATGCE
jgi:DNA-binding response OmpR family regulator